MRSNATRPGKHRRRWVIISVVMALAGCAAPPSVAPLLRVAERALAEESQRLEADARREAERMDGSLGLLEDGFNQDLERADALTAGWVREATTVYVAAREALIKHQAQQSQDRHDRADNLVAAATATRRAIALIERQDQLLNGVINEDLRRFLDLQSRHTQEAGR